MISTAIVKTTNSGEYRLMPKRSGQKRDFMQVAREVVEHAIGEQMDGNALEDPNSEKDQKAIERGRIGGLKGGRARAEKLTATQRRKIATRAAKVRWGKPRPKEES